MEDDLSGKRGEGLFLAHFRDIFP